MPSYGKAPEYQEGQDWVEYTEVLGLYLDANEVADAGKRRSILLTLCGAKTYSLIRDLVRPQKPTEKTYDEIVALVKAHMHPKPSEVAERFKFNLRSQNEGETVNEFVASLRRLSEHCNFGDFADSAIRDRLVCGLSSRHIQERLLTEKELKLPKAIEIASGMETAEKNSMRFHESVASSSEVVGLVKRNRERKSNFCFRCSKTNHTNNECYFKETECFMCGETGHIRRRCPKRVERLAKFKGKTGNQSSSVYELQCEESEEDDEPSHGRMNMLKIDDPKSGDSIEIQTRLNGKTLNMVLDTGACVSVISLKLYRDLFDNIPLRKSTIKLRAFNGQPLKVEGAIDVVVEYDNQRAKLPLYVLKVAGPALFGRNWLRHIKLNWHHISSITLENKNYEAKLQALIQNTSIFHESLGTVKGVQAHLKMKAEAVPKFLKPRKVPYAMKEKTEKR